MDATTSLKEELTKRHITLPLAHIKDWKPFTIDALGLVTLLGADEVNQSVGTLQRRRFTEYLPLLAAFVVAGDRFNAEQPGFVLYNLDDGITSTELKGWFTRWLMSQKVNKATTVLEWHKLEDSRGWGEKGIAPALSFVLVMPLLVITVLVGDWYGVGNAVAIIISVVARVYLLSKRRHVRDRVAKKDSGQKDAEIPKKRLCIIRSDGRMITLKAPESVLETFTKQQDVHHHNFYHGARWLCWLALGAHMCILGMCSLFTQIYTVILLVLGTWWFTSDFSWDLGRRVREDGKEVGKSVIEIPFNNDWSVEQIDHPKKLADGTGCDKRQYAWARLNLDDGAEVAMKAWNLFPIDAKNKNWLQDYKKLKKRLNEKEPPGDDEKDSPASTHQGTDGSRPISTALSTAHLMGEGSPPATSGPSPNSTLSDGASTVPSPGDMQTSPAAGV